MNRTGLGSCTMAGSVEPSDPMNPIKKKAGQVNFYWCIQ
jgi:hypothetical protein